MAFNKLKITYNEDLLYGDTVEFISSENGIIIFKWVNSLPLDHGEVLVGTPTANAGEISAVNYSSQFDLSYGFPYYTIEVNVNSVAITAISSGDILSDGNSNKDVDFVFGEVPVTSNKFEKINVRSPYYVAAPIYDGFSTVEPTSVEFYIFIWSGDFTTDKPLTPNYTYKKYPRFLGDNIIYIDVAQQVRDFITQNYIGVLQSNSVFVSVDVGTVHSGGLINERVEFIALDGFGNYQQGVNPTGKDIMINSLGISILKGQDIKIPFFTGNHSYTIESRTGTTVVDTDSFTSASITDTDDTITYLSVDSTGVNNIRVINDTQATKFVIDVEEVEECIYTPIKATYLNKEGVLDDFWFYKVSKEDMKVTSDSFKANVLTESIVDNKAVLSYDSTTHQNRRNNTQGKTSITLNSGYIDEQLNVSVKEMLLSEYIWLTIDDVIYPVDIVTKSVNYLTKRNDQLVKYTVKFNYSFNEVQNIR